MTMPTDPLPQPGPGTRAGAAPPPVASIVGRRDPPPPAYGGPERRDTSRAGYTGPERRHPVEPKRIFGLPRWVVISAAAYAAALLLALLWIFTY